MRHPNRETTMPKKNPSDTLPTTPVKVVEQKPEKPEKVPKKKGKDEHETSKVIAVLLTLYLDKILRGFVYFNKPMTNRDVLDLSFTHFIGVLKKVKSKNKVRAFSLFPKYKDSARFSSYTTKQIIDELEEFASDNGVVYQVAYYSAISSYIQHLIDTEDPRITKPLLEAKESFPDPDDQII
jgi:hypothetical protein